MRVVGQERRLVAAPTGKVAPQVDVGDVLGAQALEPRGRSTPAADGSSTSFDRGTSSSTSRAPWPAVIFFSSATSRVQDLHAVAFVGVTVPDAVHVLAHDGQAGVVAREQRGQPLPPQEEAGGGGPGEVERGARDAEARLPVREQAVVGPPRRARGRHVAQAEPAASR